MNTITVNGMMCNHCRQSVADAVGRIPGAGNVEVSIERKTVSWDGDASLRGKIAAAIEAIGFRVA